MVETRGSLRSGFKTKVVFSVDDSMKKQIHLAKDKFEAYTADISTLGIGILSNHFIPKGAILNAEIDGANFSLDEPLRIKCEVRYCNFVKMGEYRSGMKFLDILPLYKDKIAEFIKKNERREVPRFKVP